jgi:hypothetical protein
LHYDQQVMAGWGDFSGLNRGYVLELYDKYRQDPASVDAETRALFEQWAPVEESRATVEGLPLQKIVGAVNLAQSIRRYGHLAAQLDPLGSRPQGDPSLLPETHGVTEEDLRSLPASLVPSPACSDAANMLDVIDTFRRIYCSTIGYDYAHVFVPEERQWLRHAAECGRFRAPADPIDPVALLDRLSQVEAFERFLHRTFPGKTRFSIEGLDMLVPILDEVIGDAAEMGTRHILVGMAHRGRLNVMAHVLNKPYAQILAEFKDPVLSRAFQEDMSWTGDVKYHAGAHRAIKGGEEIDVEVRCRRTPAISSRSIRSSRGWRARPARRRTNAAPRLRPGVDRPDPDPRRRRVSPARGSSPRRSTCTGSPATRPAARSTSSRTTSSGSRRTPRTSTARRTRAAWREASRSRSSTSTRTTRKRASRSRGSRSRTGCASSATS